MIAYYSTFITGLQEVVETALREGLKNVQVDLVLDGLIVYRSDEPIQEILNLRFFNNTFLLLELSNHKHNFFVRDLIKNVLQKRRLTHEIPKMAIKNKRSFRIINSEENQLVSIDKKTLENAENFFGNKLGIQVSRAKPDLEVWFLKRNEGYGFIGLRLTKTPNYEKTLHKGELRPELAHLMCILADLQFSDVVLDPFAGYGSIPVECAKGFRIKQIIAGEKDEVAFKILQEKAIKTRSNIIVRKWDALGLAFLTDNSVDKIITDPPWGFYDNKNINLTEFYRSMFKELIRLLKPNGLMIILMGQKDLFETVISSFSKLKLLNRYDILVSGKKAAIFRIRLS